MKKVILFAAVAIFTMGSCTSDKSFRSGKRQLESQGYTDIKDTGHRMFCCSEEDTFSNGFTATDSKGNKVEGCFCSGILKGVTIRFE